MCPIRSVFSRIGSQKDDREKKKGPLYKEIKDKKFYHFCQKLDRFYYHESQETFPFSCYVELDAEFP